MDENIREDNQFLVGSGAPKELKFSKAPVAQSFDLPEDALEKSMSDLKGVPVELRFFSLLPAKLGDIARERGITLAQAFDLCIRMGLGFSFKNLQVSLVDCIDEGEVAIRLGEDILVLGKILEGAVDAE